MIDLQDYRAYMVMAFVCEENQEMTQAQKEQLEIIDRAITAEKAIEMIVKKCTMVECWWGADKIDSICANKNCNQCLIDWAMEKAREQG